MTNPTSSPPPPPPSPPLLHEPLSPSYSSLPDEIIENCLARISHSYYYYLCLVSKSFYSLLSSPDLYTIRSQIGATEPRLYVCLSLPTTTQNWFTLYDPGQNNGGEIESELRLVQVKLSSSSYSPPSPLNATTVAVGSEIYQIGGSNNDKPSTDVHVLDCRSHTWRRGPNMMVARKDAKSCYIDGKIYVFGGSLKKEEPMNWGEVFDVKTQTWKPLPSPSDNRFHRRDNHIRVFGGKLYVITVENKKYEYDPKEGRWILDVGFVCGRIILFGPSRPWCVIENVMFISDGKGNCRWYDEKNRNWLIVRGLGTYMDRANYYCTLQLVNYGGKLVIIWEECIAPWSVVCCAVIRLEKKRSRSYSEPEIWGVIERSNVVVPRVHNSVVPRVHNSSKLLSSVSVSV